MEKNTYESLSNEQLIEKRDSYKKIRTVLLAISILTLIGYYFMIGYAIGKDAATGGKGEFYNKPFIVLLIAFISGTFYVESEVKAIEKEIQKR
jgi:hypothetical protein